MTKLIWDAPEYEVGTDRGVFYPLGGPAEAWSGLVSVIEKIADGAENVRYLDGIRVINRQKEASFAATIVAHTYPPSFFVTFRSPFGFSYRTKTPNGYKLHLVYNVLAQFPGQSYSQEDTAPFSVDISTMPLAIADNKPTAHLVVDAGIAYPPVVSAFEDVLYGTESADGRLPYLDEIISIFEANSLYKIIDNGDGTATMIAPDDAFNWLDPTEFVINWPKVITIDNESYMLRTW